MEDEFVPDFCRALVDPFKSPVGYPDDFPRRVYEVATAVSILAIIGQGAIAMTFLKSNHRVFPRLVILYIALCDMVVSTLGLLTYVCGYEMNSLTGFKTAFVVPYMFFLTATFAWNCCFSLFLLSITTKVSNLTGNGVRVFHMKSHAFVWILSALTASINLFPGGVSRYTLYTSAMLAVLAICLLASAFILLKLTRTVRRFVENSSFIIVSSQNSVTLYRTVQHFWLFPLPLVLCWALFLIRNAIWVFKGPPSWQFYMAATTLNSMYGFVNFLVFMLSFPKVRAFLLGMLCFCPCAKQRFAKWLTPNKGLRYNQLSNSVPLMSP